MLLPALLTSDLHLTSDPAHEYRWSLFPWLRDACASESVRTLLILGDLTDAKDGHPAELINRVARSLVDLRAQVESLEDIYILMGNHDYLREGHPTFAFLNYIEGLHFIHKPHELMDDDKGIPALLLPHSKTPAADWGSINLEFFAMVFIHQTVKGARASNGQVMEGTQIPRFDGLKVYSGDIHVPQVISDVEYVGSPYHVHFGDKFKPRCVLLDRRGRPHDLFPPNIKRVALTVRDPHEFQRIDWLEPGDQVKLRVELAQADRHLFKKFRLDLMNIAEHRKVRLMGLEAAILRSETPLNRVVATGPRSLILSDPDLIQRYVQQEDLGGDALDIGLGLIEQ